MNTKATSGTAEATILVKAALQPSKKEEMNVYSVGVTKEGEWVRIYPVTFQKRSVPQLYKRWDTVRFSWQRPAGDTRPESLRVDPDSIEVLGDMPYSKRRDFIAGLEATSLKDAHARGRSIVLLRPRKAMFSVRRKTGEEMVYEKETHDKFTRLVVAADPSAKPKQMKIYPYKFVYRYWTDDGEYESAYRDGEMHNILANMAASYGEAQAVSRIIQVWGKDYLKKGILFAMSRDTLATDTWMINGVISVEEIEDMSGASYAYNVLA